MYVTLIPAQILGADGHMGFPCKWSVSHPHSDPRSTWVFHGKMVSNDLTVCFDHAYSFEHFDHYFHLIFCLKLNKDTAFEASVLAYDRYKPPLGLWSCHRYLEL